MGKLVIESLVRLVVVLVVVFLIRTALPDDKFWLILTIAAILAGVVLPAYTGYKKFYAQNREIIENSICSKCRHFDESAVLCTKYESHPKPGYIPCGEKEFETS
ncbi:MAG: hypothetical protein IPJ75_14765 [Ignavibacteriales bacterium]|nr:hypothetical protein [Ignavibacteriales bacterium]